MKQDTKIAVLLAELIDDLSRIKVDTSSQNETVVLLRLLYRQRYMHIVAQRIKQQELIEGLDSSGDIRELAHDVMTMTATAIEHGQKLLPLDLTPSYIEFLDETTDTEDWFEHLLNSIEPEYGAAFYHAIRNGKIVS